MGQHPELVLLFATPRQAPSASLAFLGGAKETRTPDPRLKGGGHGGGPAAAQVKRDAGGRVNNRESPWVTPLQAVAGTGRFHGWIARSLSTAAEY